jgi:hypothetical protein
MEGSPIVATATDSLRLLPPDRLPAVLCSKSFRSSWTCESIQTVHRIMHMDADRELAAHGVASVSHQFAADDGLQPST